MTPDSTDTRLDQIDHILGERSKALRALRDQAAELHAEQSAFLSAFAAKCEKEIAPAMESIVSRLRANGGGGLVDYEPDGGRVTTTPRLTLWMSFEGEITGTPRQDRHPYFQLDADVGSEKAKISEGDMWEGGGSHHSGPLGLWDLEAVTAERVTDEVLSILSRAAQEPGIPDS
jgi:hypothetical protein